MTGLVHDLPEPDASPDLILQSASYSATTGFTTVVLKRSIDSGDMDDVAITVYQLLANNFTGKMLKLVLNSLSPVLCCWVGPGVKVMTHRPYTPMEVSSLYHSSQPLDYNSKIGFIVL